MNINIELLKSKIDYDRESGIFIKKSNGKILGSKHKKGYIVIWFKDRLYLAHRLAWIFEFGHIDDRQIDHINHNKTDNRISNLRLVTNQENHRNKRSVNGKILGVNWYAPYNMWRARITVDGKDMNLGYFKDFNDAVSAIKNAEAHFNFHENHGKEL